MLTAWALLFLPLSVVRAVQLQPSPRKFAPRFSINFHASRHMAGTESFSQSFARLSLEHQLEDRHRAYLCRGQFTPARIINDHKNLTFIHIPRCAGTSIEDCTHDDDLGWGSLDPRLHGLYSIDKGKRCFKQHVPPTVLPELYENKVTFCVVRNPYERMISEYHFPLTKGFGDRARAGKCNAEGLNNFTIESLSEILNQKNPYTHDCHLLPQAAYVFGWDFKTSTVTKERVNNPWCKHIVRQEHLQADFNKLMEDNGYSYRLTSMVNPHTVAGPYWNCTHVNPEDFGPEARKMINEYWKDDFELLNFTMLPVDDAQLVQNGRHDPTTKDKMAEGKEQAKRQDKEQRDAKKAEEKKKAQIGNEVNTQQKVLPRKEEKKDEKIITAEVKEAMKKKAVEERNAKKLEARQNAKEPVEPESKEQVKKDEIKKLEKKKQDGKRKNTKAIANLVQKIGKEQEKEMKKDNGKTAKEAKKKEGHKKHGKKKGREEKRAP